MRSVTEHCSRWLFLFFADAVLLCFATWSLQIAVEWLRQGVSKGACSPVLSCDWFVFCKSFLALELLHEWRVLNVRIYAKHFPGLRRFRCGEKLARMRDSNRRFQVTFSLLCWRYAFVFCNSASADRSGMAAHRCLERSLFSSIVLRLICVLQVILGRSQWNCYMNDVFWMFGFSQNIMFSRFAEIPLRRKVGSRARQG